ncbi:MAG TPA: hypothetical protein DCW29_19665 [Janthinobacterium sp.]|nr:hypothetical protein [Janthinobacterium sp.]
MPTLRATLLCAALAAVFGAAGAAPKTAFEASCVARLSPALTIQAIESGYQVDNTVSSRVLHNRGAHGHASDLMLGMTAVTSRVEVGVAGSTLQDPSSGRECLAPRIDIELRYLPLQVFVAREFSPFGCPYRAVLEHEMRHVRLYLEHLPAVAALLRAELERRYRGAPLYAASGQGLTLLQEQVDDWLWPMIKTEMHRVELFQAALDTEDEAFHLSGACGGELADNLKARY